MRGDSNCNPTTDFFPPKETEFQRQECHGRLMGLFTTGCSRGCQLHFVIRDFFFPPMVVQCHEDGMPFPAVHGGSVWTSGCVALGRKWTYSRDLKKGNIPDLLFFSLAA